MFRASFASLIILLWQPSWAQLNYRSAVTTGDWESNASWETFNGTSWVPAMAPPTASDGVITVLAGHTIIFQSDEIVDHVVVNGTLKSIASANVLFPAS